WAVGCGVNVDVVVSGVGADRRQKRWIPEVPRADHTLLSACDTGESLDDRTSDTRRSDVDVSGRCRTGQVVSDEPPLDCTRRLIRHVENGEASCRVRDPRARAGLLVGAENGDESGRRRLLGDCGTGHGREREDGAGERDGESAHAHSSPAESGPITVRRYRKIGSKFPTSAPKLGEDLR